MFVYLLYILKKIVDFLLLLLINLFVCLFIYYIILKQKSIAYFYYYLLINLFVCLLYIK